MIQYCFRKLLQTRLVKKILYGEFRYDKKLQGYTQLRKNAYVLWKCLNKIAYPHPTGIDKKRR